MANLGLLLASWILGITGEPKAQGIVETIRHFFK